MGRVVVSTAAGWSSACSSAFVPLRVRSAAPDFRAGLSQAVLAPGITVTHVTSDASDVYRSDRVIAANPRDDVLLSLHRSGTGSITQHDRTAHLRRGSAALYDASAPYTLSFPGRMSEVVLQVPRRTIAQVGHGFADLTARTLPAGAPLRALTSLATSVHAREGQPRPLEDAALADALVSLLRAALVERTSHDALPLDAQALHATMRAYIDEHLTNPQLSPERLAAAHYVSLRLVQKIFAAEGESPAAAIRRRRLEHARRMLAAGQQVGVAAVSSGFSGPDTFARAFKAEFGVSPSAVIG